MSEAEFAAWTEFYKLYPFDDFHRFHRPAALVSVSLAGGEIQPRLDWLQPDRASEGVTDTMDDDAALLRAFGIDAKGG